MEFKAHSHNALPKVLRSKNWVKSGLLLAENPAAAMLAALLVYAFFAILHGPLWSTSAVPYYNYLAEAFLHGQLNLRIIPETTHDLVFYAGKYYLYWPPLPAVLLIPFVALFGVGFSDILFTLAVGSANVYLAARLLRLAGKHGLVQITAYQRGLLVLFFAFGTVHLTLAPYGRVWYTGQLVALFFVLLAYSFAIQFQGGKAFFFTGAAIACAAATRNHLIFTAIWPAYYLVSRHSPEGWRRLSRVALLGVLPLALALGSLAAYNFLRFGSIFDVGLDYHRMDPMFRQDYQEYGPFSLHYLADNLYYQYLAYPFPFSQESYMGGSLFLLSPLFLAAFWGIGKGKSALQGLALAGTILTVSIPILLLMGTGWIQFGPRYSLDFAVPLLLLTARGLNRWPYWLSAASALISIVHYTAGVLLLQRVM